MNKRILAIIMIITMLCGMMPTQYLLGARVVSAAESTSEENKSEEQTSEEKTSEEKTSEEKTSEEKPTEEQTSEEKTTEGNASEEQNTSETPLPEAPTTEELPTENPANAEGVLTNLSPANTKVIVIDPGHCKVHTGAYGNGLKEEVAVLEISKACQSKLDTYADVTVYMTRTTGACCKNLDLGDCLSCRNRYAKRLDADFLVSMHINASYGNQNGACVLTAYKSGYNDRIRKETQAFGKIVLKNLKELGFKNLGQYLRKSASYKYSNGKTADYYSIVRLGVIYKIPSVIIEHGFISNAADCKKFLKTKAKRDKLGEVDADAIISYYNLSNPVLNGKMTTMEDGTYYILEDGRKALGWIKCEGKWYFFDKQTGKMQKGFIEDEGERFFLDRKTGMMIDGWIKDGTERYLAKGNGCIVRNQTYYDSLDTYLFDDEGKLLKLGLHEIDGKTYYVNYQNHVLSGDLNIGGKRYLFDSETKAMRYGLVKQGKKYYYADKKTGVLACNKIVNVNGARYYFNKSGVRTTGWVTYKGAKYYFSTGTGKMAKGWKKIGGYYYYFNKSNGKMQKNKRIGGYYVNSQGIRTKKK